MLSNREFDFFNTVENGRTLFVGEGNFSFSLSIARSIYNRRNVVATTNEKPIDFSPPTKNNIKTLQQLGCDVYHNIDCTKLERIFLPAFDNVIFQFPNVGSRDPIEDRNPNFILLRDFLESAKHVLNDGGQVIVTIVNSEYYANTFQIPELFEISGYKTIDAYYFNPLRFTNYQHTMTNENRSALSKSDDCITIVFGL